MGVEKAASMSEVNMGSCKATPCGVCFDAGGGGSRSIFWTCVCLLLLSLAGSEAQMQPHRDIPRSRGEKVCQSVDVRNSVMGLKQQLSDCVVVEGFVHLTLIEGRQDFGNLSFPQLREITGYLLVYRVDGIRSLGQLFPNLTVIRGQTLFINYALVIFEANHLEEVGLYSLTNILRGGVRIVKNPSLCFADTVDWNAISPDGHYIQYNRGPNECPLCPADCQNSCWNQQHCQKVCPAVCKADDKQLSCMSNGTCCHPMCLGGCYGLADTDCIACKYVQLPGVGARGQCLSSCPSSFYKHHQWRCISATACRNMPTPRYPSDTNSRWKPFGDQCRLDCPANYSEVTNGMESNCEKCQGICRKECQSAIVDSIASAQKLRGCTYINGSLEIQIRGGRNMVKELEENLKMIEEIGGYLKVVRSFPIISLDFLKKLRVIHGNELESNRYSIVVLDNQNLQDLWNWERRETLKIKKGRFFFHFNPKLCLYKIEKLSQIANLKPQFTDHEVALTSNGDKVACNLTKLHVSVTQVHENSATIVWEQFEHYDPRSLLGYVVYHTEAPTQNLTLYDGRDACGKDGWEVTDVKNQEEQANVTHSFENLKPFTQYAFYIKTYTIASERTGAQSDIIYFKTKPAQPSTPAILQAISNSSTEIYIEWKPPDLPNGEIMYYIVSGKWNKYNATHLLTQRDYCSEPVIKTEVPILHPPETKKPVKDCCSCKDGEGRRIDHNDELEVMSQILFEDRLHNYLYVKKSSKSKREIQDDAYYKSEMMADSNYKYNQHNYNDYEFLSNETAYEAKPDNFTYKVNGTSLHIRNLHHYANYNIQVKACRKPVPNDSLSTCSDWISQHIVTMKKVGADNINFTSLDIQVMNESEAEVRLKWSEPLQPNGIIVTYQIEYQRLEPGTIKQTSCIQRDKYASMNFYKLKISPAGNYSIQVRAVSLAGPGESTPPKYVVIAENRGSSNIGLLVGVVIGTIFLLMTMFLAVLYFRRKYVPGIPRLIALVNPEYVSAVYVPDEWEIPRSKIEMLKELGTGSFGKVFQGIGHNIVDGQPVTPCAIKTVSENATDRERSEFLNEASVMKAFNTHHVVRLLGVVSQGQPVLVVMELMANGDLKTYLRSHRPNTSQDPIKSNDEPIRQPPTLQQILQMAAEIADGMAYLSAKKFVHRDLAARNCMVSEDLTVKIGDFGMTRDIYETDYYRKGTKGLLPVRWMAPESLKDGVFTSLSDVWSYGVVLWEMATLASQPYQGLSNDQVLRYVIDGGVMERPDNCPNRLYELMHMCWHYRPSARPSFMDLVNLLLPDVSKSFAQVSFYHSTEGCDIRAHQKAEALAIVDDPSTPLRITRDIEDFSLGESDHEDNHLESCQPYTSMSGRSSNMNVGRDDAVKVGNGSAVTTPVAANGWPNRTNSETGNGSNVLRTTEC